MTPHDRHPELTQGEVAVLIAPIAGIEPEEVGEYVNIIITVEGGLLHARLHTSMDDDSLLEVLVRAINHVVGDMV